jgi:hypothetical protein
MRGLGPAVAMAVTLLWAGVGAAADSGEGRAPERLVSFVNEVVPILTKQGCNGGVCHGKATGQNGFKLSLFGFEPDEDYEHLVFEQRGRRLVPSAPEESLLLTKGAATVPHGGGKRLEPGSVAYTTLMRWIAQGMPSDLEDAARPKLLGIQVTPEALLMKPGQTQQLVVTARFSDGSTREVTSVAALEPNPKGIAQVDENTGVLTMGQKPGAVAVMARYQDKVSVFRGTLPLGIPVRELPEERNVVDRWIFARLKEVGMPPSPLCDDATFLRRVTLDLAGRLPTAEEVLRFAENPAKDKRARWIDTLLESGEYADTFANYWSQILRNRRSEIARVNQQSQIQGNFAFHAWIRESLYRNKPYDRFVRELLTATGMSRECPPVTWYRQVDTLIQQTEDTAQLFLGVRLQCAQCHHHPFEQWSQRDYYALGAYFSQVERTLSPSRMAEFEISLKRSVPEAVHKKTGEKLKPGAVGVPAPELTKDDDAREALANWMAEPGNPYFAKALVNRYWKLLFGRGLVDPEDDMRATNPPSHPELLEALAKEFVAGGFDLKQLLRTLANSSTYQLDAAPNAHNAEDSQYFSRFYARRLPAEALLDGINTVAGASEGWGNQTRGTRAMQLPDNSYNGNAFLREFGRPDSATACTCERQSNASLGQGLMLATAGEIQSKLGSPQGTARRFATDGKRSDDEKLRDLYLSAFARAPKESELAIAREHLQKVRARSGADPVQGMQQAWEDLVWAVVNSGEFLMNH